MGLWEERLETRHLIVRQPEKTTHITAPFFGTVIQMFRPKSIGPEPSNPFTLVLKAVSFHRIQSGTLGLLRLQS